MGITVTSGWAKGLALKTPPTAMTRPTAAKVRAAVLNMVGPYLSSAGEAPSTQPIVLDLCAGSGALGIEALSRDERGAGDLGLALVAVEASRAAVSCLRQNIQGLTQRAQAQGLPLPATQILAESAQSAMSRLVRERRAGRLAPVALVLFDPPYKDARVLVPELAEPVAELVANEAIWIIESAAEDGGFLAALVESGSLGPWTLVKQKAYGDTMITMLLRN